MRLYIIRHAWAEEPGPQWADDSQRPLTADGRKRFRKVVEALAERGFAPQVIATSPYVRARETADLIVRHLGRNTPQLETVDALRCGSDLAAALQWSAGRTEDEVAWVGHMPDVAEMTAALIGDKRTGIDFNKGAVAALDFGGRPTQAAGVLRWFVTAKLLGV
ncbi:MAG: histidine phosphatase family protein [Planctomycetaceae bacterium]|nr:histidine phosphatase family protein [Planctomycetaceae bacterium]